MIKYCCTKIKITGFGKIEKERAKQTREPKKTIKTPGIKKETK